MQSCADLRFLELTQVGLDAFQQIADCSGRDLIR